jgi:hypothetical protein
MHFGICLLLTGLLSLDGFSFENKLRDEGMVPFVSVGDAASPLRTSLQCRLTPSLFIVPPMSAVNSGLLYESDQFFELIADRESMIWTLNHLSGERPTTIQRILEIPNY